VSSFKSIVTLLSISILASALAAVNGNDYVYIFYMTLIFQLILGFTVSSIRNPILQLRAEAIENERIQSFSQQGVDLKCAHCGSISIVPVVLDEKNEYDCPSCDNSNSLYINITVARKTNMLNMQHLVTSSIDDESTTIDTIRNE